MKTEHPTQTTNTSTSIPDWLSSAAQGAASNAQSLPQYAPYTGPGYAGLTPAQLQALGLSQGNAGTAQGVASGAQPTLNGLMGFSAPQVTAAGLAPQINGLLNPATQSVVDTTNAQLDKNTATSVNAMDNASAANHAFGGDRAAIADAVIRNQGDMTKAATDASLNQGNFNTALSAALSAAQGNQGAAVNSAGINLGAANGVGGAGGLASTLSGLNTADIGQLLTAGGQQQQTATNQNLFNYQNYLNSYQIPDQQATTLASILGSLPHDTTGNSATTGTAYSNPFMGIAGLGLAAAGMPAAGGGSLGGNFLSGLFGH